MSHAMRWFEVKVCGSSIYVSGIYPPEGDDTIEGIITLHGLATDAQTKEIGDKLEEIFGPLREKAKRQELCEVIDRTRRKLEEAEGELREMDSSTTE